MAEKDDLWRELWRRCLAILLLQLLGFCEGSGGDRLRRPTLLVLAMSPRSLRCTYSSAGKRARPASMRMSCNGCRALRKGCSDDCSIRHCLQWIKSAESQANATLFLSKFYGRAGLMNLINSGSEERRPAIFRSLLYEACGRMINPVYGSAGLLWSGDWHLCQAGVEAVLKGSPIKPVSSDPGGVKPTGYIPETTTSSCDIRHVSKEATASLQVFGQHAAAGSANANLRKRSGGNGGTRVSPDAAHSYRLFKKLRCSRTKFQEDQRRASCLSQDSGESGDSSMVTTQVADPRKDDCNLELELDLTLGIRP